MSIRGKVIVFTGKISRPRHEFQALVESNGGIAGSSVTSSTDYLVVGDDPGEKLAKATLLGTSIISEADLLKLIEGEEESKSQSTEEVLRKAYEFRTPIISLNGLIDYPPLITLKCKWCGSSYQQWDDSPKYETCPVCEITSRPKCPKCGSTTLLFLTSLNTYYCKLCDLFFDAPYSERTYQTEHLHVLDKAGRCLFCHKLNPPPAKFHEGKTMTALREIAKESSRNEASKRAREEEEALDFVASLSEEERKSLKEQLRGPS